MKVEERGQRPKEKVEGINQHRQNQRHQSLIHRHKGVVSHRQQEAKGHRHSKVFVLDICAIIGLKAGKSFCL